MSSNIALLDRIANLESVIFGGPNTNGGPLVAADTLTHYTGSTDALAYAGTAIIDATGVDACTLATPVVGQDDGKRLRIISTTAHAHTVTTAANKIANGATTAFGDTLTFAAKQGANCLLFACQGIWYLVEATNVTLSEV